MTTSYRIIKLAFCGPSDVLRERDVALKVVNEWNLNHGDALDAMVKFQHWSTDSAPDMSERAQAVINRQIIDESEIIVAVLWSRFGTPSGVAQSGTEEEIRRGMARGIRTMLYFSNLEATKSQPDPAQLAKVAAFRSEMISAGLAGSFRSRREFESSFRTHLAKAVHEILAEAKSKKPKPAAKKARSVRQSAKGDANVQVGGDNHGTISVTLKQEKVEKSKYPGNSIGADADLTNYAEYLCDLWVKFMAPIEPNTDAAWARIGKAIKTKFRLRKRTRNHLSASRFPELVEFLTAKLAVTPVGKKHVRNGTKLCRTFEEFRDGPM